MLNVTKGQPALCQPVLIPSSFNSDSFVGYVGFYPFRIWILITPVSLYFTFPYTKGEDNSDFSSTLITDVLRAVLNLFTPLNSYPGLWLYLYCLFCVIYQYSCCHEPPLSCVVWASMADRRLNQSQDQELFTLQQPSLLLQTSLLLLKAQIWWDTWGVIFSTQVSRLTWTNSAGGWWAVIKFLTMAVTFLP